MLFLLLLAAFLAAAVVQAFQVKTETHGGGNKWGFANATKDPITRSVPVASLFPFRPCTAKITTGRSFGKWFMPNYRWRANIMASYLLDG